MQTTNNILLIRPANFGFNNETRASNVFQKELSEDAETIRQKASHEFEAFAAKLKSHGVNVRVFDDTPSPAKTDAVFPNNWISFHADGTVILYPMLSSNRRLEKRAEIIEALRNEFEITKIIDLSAYEDEDRFLEGTGSVVFDHEHKIAYAAVSPRTDKELFVSLCEKLDYEPVTFTARDRAGVEIYHTNVLMCVGERFAVVCLESITDEHERADVADRLTATSHEIVDITFEQMNSFAGNMLAVADNLLVMSQSAYDSLSGAQIHTLEKYCEPLPLAIPTIETVGGGSARCMIAEIFLPKT
ncbi:MAG: citrulline utilization hydrolase CtlX [Pyrinomonadaceae bacterium]